jgi:hypothetical protein
MFVPQAEGNHNTHLLFGVPLVIPFAMSYRYLSLNRAGSYYNNQIQMVFSLPKWAKTGTARCTSRGRAQYLNGIKQEQTAHVFRTMDLVETGIIYLLTFVVSEVAEMVAGHIDKRLDPEALDMLNTITLYSRSCCAAFLFIIHRVLAANFFQVCCLGFLQPEGMWMIVEGVDPADRHCRCIQPSGRRKMIACMAHPELIY